ncbi:hypothetical protein FoTM2_017771 [Fusarium oxysporum f. sp. vasinfectum]|nr:hypothetical protein FoTM2_017771 [Fusarium oxysporum f. sp. vasinfectum]
MALCAQGMRICANTGYYSANTPAHEAIVRGHWMHLSASANPRSDRNDVRDCHPCNRLFRHTRQDPMANTR